MVTILYKIPVKLTSRKYTSWQYFAKCDKLTIIMGVTLYLRKLFKLERKLQTNTQ